jgi:hypothetical protein
MGIAAHLPNRALEFLCLESIGQNPRIYCAVKVVEDEADAYSGTAVEMPAAVAAKGQAPEHLVDSPYAP